MEENSYFEVPNVLTTKKFYSSFIDQPLVIEFILT